MAKHYKKRLKTMENARVYLSDIINRTEAGEIEPGLSGKLGYLISILIRVLEGSDLEQRIKALEKRILK